MNFKHRYYGTKIYNIWASIIQRCNNKNHKQYKDYGGRNPPIKVCKRWSDKNGFKNFLKDVGEIPKGLTLDRINNNRGYNPKNWKYSTYKEQQRNTRKNINITFNNKTQCLKDWAIELKINYDTLWHRIYTLKWSIEKAFLTPLGAK